MQSQYSLGALLGAVLLLGGVPAIATAHDGENLADLVDEVRSSVVNITAVYPAKKKSVTNTRQRGLPEEFRRFFPPEMQPYFQSPEEGNGGNADEYVGPKPMADGSGFILSADGYIVTSFHVVDEAEKVLVTLQDRREFEAEIIGLDKYTDLALLKVEAKGLQAARLGNAAELRVGQSVAAIGSPFKLDFSVTQGVISALGRAVQSQDVGRYVPFIQTDVAINPGNSGGPLYDMQGYVIGVNAQIYTRTGGYMGLSFSVPIDIVQQVIGQLRDEGHVSRGWLGVAVQDVTRDLAESMNLPKPVGALVSAVVEDSPAEEAKFEPGDVIVRLNSKDIIYAKDLPPAVGAIAPEKQVRIQFYRNGKKHTALVRMGELSDDTLQANVNSSRSGKNAVSRLGMKVQQVPEAKSKEFKLKNDQGVMVASIQRGGPAHRAGLKRGDIIVSLDRKKLQTPEEFHKIVQELPEGRAVWMQMIRGGQKSIVTIRPHS